MLLEKPEDVKHENSSGTVCAIYGVDAHPTLQLFATAGGDNTLLATLANHQQAVNCVRWAGHGRYLASGSDDQLVLLYELQAGAPAPVPFGSNARPNKQNWVRCSTLERHTMDVADVAWSPDDRMLATCSIDNTILIWDVGVGALSEVMTQPLQTLTGHNGWVKGVAWDPVGKYLSSAGEDKTVRMWKVADWQQSDVVTEPFEGCASTSHFRRLSWSPDGSVLCATHAFSSKKNIASLLNRGSWTNDLKFVGHQGVVTSARFNPKLLVTKADPEKEFACCAVGGEDATVSIWLAHLARPLAVIKDCFDSSVTDLTWSSSQSLLLACSLDGSICCFQFAGDEIGTPISDVQQSKLLQAKYGSRAGITLASTLVENPIQLQLEEKSTTSPRLAVSRTAGTNAAPVLTHTTNTLIPKKKKKLGTQASSAPQNKPPAGTSTSDKKRIAPVLLQTDAQSSANNPASSHNNIRNILGPTIASPTASDVTLLDSRMASTSGKEVSVVPDTNNSAKLQASSELSPSETTGPTHKEKEKMRVADDSFVFSDFASALPTDAVTVKSVPRGIASAMLSGMSDPLMQRNVTRSHLEHQVAAAIVLKSSAEYRYWIQAYARFLTHDEDVTRLDDLCAEMMGPFHAPSSLIATDGKNPNSNEGSEWEPMVLDAVKRDVLKLHILPTIAANRALQRVVTKYQLMLSEIEAREKTEEDEDES
ncbi:WD repeat HIR1 [Phytophthora cactorum]|nr:WD repeat HIR1 [Phytophthora cactorum]